MVIGGNVEYIETPKEFTSNVNLTMSLHTMNYTTYFVLPFTSNKQLENKIYLKEKHKNVQFIERNIM